MALLVGDGFDHYTSPFLMDKWDFESLSGGGLSDGPNLSQGRLGSQGIALFMGPNRGEVPGIAKNLGVNLTTFGIVGAAFRMPNMGTSGSSAIFHFTDPVVNASAMVAIYVGSNGSIRAESPIGTTVATTAPGLVTANAFRYMEAKVKVHSTLGRVIVRLDSSVVLDTGAGGINTRPYGTTNQYSRIGIGGSCVYPYSGLYMTSFDDFYFCDDTGAVNNDFLGDVQLQAIYPNGVGSSTQWAIGGTTPAASNWQSVNEKPPDNDVTYVKSPTVGQLDMYTMDDITATAVGIKGLLMNVRVKKDDATSRTYSTMAKDVNAAGATTAVAVRSAPGTYVNQQDVSEVSPTTGVAWTVAGVNAMEAGIKVIT